MTVVAALKFNPTHAAIIADEQVNYGLRKAELKNKVFSDSLGGWLSYALGSSGVASLSEELTILVPEFIQKQYQKPAPERELFTARDAANLFADAALQFRKQYLEKYFLNYFRLSEEEFKHGRLLTGPGEEIEISERLMDRYLSMIGEEGSLASEYPLGMVALLKPHEKEVELYRFLPYSSGTFELCPLPYAATGSGEDAADLILTEFVEELPRKKREDIDPREGLAVLLRAVYAAGKRNIGVGGTPSLCILKDDEVYRAEENASRLGMIITQATVRGFIPKEFRNEALEALFYGNVNWRDVKKMMIETADKNKDFLIEYFLGFRE